MITQLFRGRILHCTKSWQSAGAASVQYMEDGILALEGDTISVCAEAETLIRQGMDVSGARHMQDKLIVPGFIDTHVHSAQLDIIASYGEQLMQWLERYTFPSEARFADADMAAEISDIFLSELIDAGTTTAAVYTTTHPAATESLFSAAAKRQMCLIAGKVLMNRNAPDELLDGEDLGIPACRRLIETWHGQGRLHYAVTPRFAITSTVEQLSQSGALLKEFPGLYMQTHLSENLEEIAQVKQLFPQAKNYLDTYEMAGLLGERSIFAHGIHLQAEEIQSLADSGSSVAFCPSSNLFLGSGLLDIEKLQEAKVATSLGSDVGGGTSLSVFRTLADAYKVCQLLGNKLEPMQAFHMATLGNASSLQLQDRIGNLREGSDADFLVLDPSATSLIQRRVRSCRDIAEEWFVYMTLGDERLVAETWIAGRPVHSHRKNNPKEFKVMVS